MNDSTGKPGPAPVGSGLRNNDAVTREELHFRRIDMRGWRRSDGLYEVEGRVTDRKPYPFKTPNGPKVVPANEPIHDMGVKLVFDEDLLVHDIVSFTDSAPYEDCHAAGQALATLKGVRIASGWSGEVHRRLGGEKCCTHLMQILIPLATTAFQTVTMVRLARPDVFDANGKPVKVDSCYAYAANRGVVMRRWPAFYTGPVVPEK